MRHRLAIILGILFILALATVTVFAGWIPGFGGSGNNTINYTVTTKGDFDTLAVHMTALLDATCANGGGNEAPGQFQVQVEHYAVLSTAATRENGTNTYTFEVQGPMDPPPTWDEVGCPNENWTVARLTGFISGTLAVTGTNGRTDNFITSCFYNSSVIGPMACTIQEA